MQSRMEKRLFRQLLGFGPTIDELYILWSDVESLRPLIATEVRQSFGVQVRPMNREQRKNTFSRCRERRSTSTGVLISKIRELQVAY